MNHLSGLAILGILFDAQNFHHSLLFVHPPEELLARKVRPLFYSCVLLPMVCTRTAVVSSVTLAFTTWQAVARGGGGGGYSMYPWVRRCGAAPHTLALFKTNIVNFPTLFKTEFRFFNMCPSTFFPISKTKFWSTSIKCIHDNGRVHFLSVSRRFSIIVGSGTIAQLL